MTNATPTGSVCPLRRPPKGKDHPSASRTAFFGLPPDSRNPSSPQPSRLLDSPHHHADVGLADEKSGLNLERPVALKILPPEVAHDADRMRRFVQEAKTASALSHPNVARVFEIGEADGVSFLAMEYIKGETLDAHIAGAPLPLAEAIGIAMQVADALAASHAPGLVHRDIKPANIMIAPRGHVSVLDFGLAKMKPPAAGSGASRTATQFLTDPGMVMGTV